MCDYIIKDVIPKNGIMRDIHEEVLGRRCYIISAEVGCRGLLKYLPDYDDRYHRLHTSTIVSVKDGKSGDEVIIETVNTIYRLSEIRQN